VNVTVSGHLALEFANTLDNYRRADPYDFIPDCPALVEFALRTGIIDRGRKEAILRALAADPGVGSDLLGRVRALRSKVHSLFSALAAGQEAPAIDLEFINLRMREASVHARIEQEPRGFIRVWSAAPGDPDQLLWPLVDAAVDLLTSADLARLRQCAGNNCTWMFLDGSKNRSRRWCSMDVCGNRAKSQRHYARLRTPSKPGPSSL
jgi:predicted RNA-binding Zn ribbon-like protein